MNVNLTPNITGKNVNIIKGATQADLTNSVNNSKIYRDEAEAFSIVSEAKSVEASYSALNASISSTTASDKATIATTKANEASNSAINASASEAVCIAKATITTDKANIATAQSVIATDKANEASVSANAAATQAGIATTKASEASTSASNALTSENNADTSEANALIYRNQAESFANSINPSNLVHISGTETITGNKTFSGTVSGLTKATVGLNNVDNTSDSSKSVNYATTAGTASASDVYSWAKEVSKPSYTASEIGLGNVTNESKATMFTSPTFTGTVTLPSTTSIGNVSSTELGYIDGVTSSIQTQLDSKVAKVTSTDNAVVRFNGATGEVQDSKVVISDNGYISANGTTIGEHVFKPNTTSEFVRLAVTASDYSSLPSWTGTFITQYGSTATGNFLGSIPNANLGGLWSQNISNMLIGNNAGSPIIFANGSIERMRIDASGNVLLTSGTGALGYGAGAGGIVTQLTSKSTAVTLNKPSGRITTHNAALASGAEVAFVLINSLVTYGDGMLITPSDVSDNYSIKARIGVGVVVIFIKNVSGGSLSDSINFNFQIIKGATE